MDIFPKKELKKKNLIVFDIDGTLTDSVAIHQNAFVETLVEIGVKNLNSDFKSFKHHTDSFIAKEIYENDTDEIFSDLIRTKFEKGLTERINTSSIEEIKGASRLIDHLKHNTNYTVCYATGSLLRPAKFKLDSIGVHYDEKLLVASDNIYSREDIVSAAIRKARGHYGIEKFDRIISVGDGLWDLLTAKNLGLEFIGVGESNKKALEQNGANIILKDLTELRPYLFRN